MAQEIERKFHVVTDPDAWELGADVESAWLISQGYLTEPGANPEIRIRSKTTLDPKTARSASPEAVLGDDGPVVKHLLTIKKDFRAEAGKGLSRHEFELAISSDDFTEARRAVDGPMLEKVRTVHVLRIPGDDPRVVEVDEYRGALTGLVLAEIEFATWDDSVGFSPPGFLGVEVTDRPEYRNANLARAAAPPKP